MYQPLLAVVCGAVAVFVGMVAVDPKISNTVIFKAKLLLRGLLQMVLCKDMKIKTMPEAAMPSKLFVDGSTKRGYKKKRIIFIRHGESEWNYMFNSGFGLGFPIRVIKGLIKECIVFSLKDSVFLDSSLSARGYQQAKDLRKFLRESSRSGQDTPSGDVSALVKGQGLLVTSNLRRACKLNNRQGKRKGEGKYSLGIWDEDHVKKMAWLIILFRRNCNCWFARPTEIDLRADIYAFYAARVLP